MTRFNSYVRAHDPSEPTLPLVHTCDAYSFRGIVTSAKVEPAPCNVFQGESLVYLFYGRPAYRTARGKDSVTQLAFFPVCLILAPGAVQAPRRIAPFDTGAFQAGRFGRHFHDKMKCADFMMDPSLEMPGRLVGLFFGDNRGYFEAKPKSQEVPPGEFEVASYVSLITDTGAATFDDRSASIELQSDRQVVLSHESVLAVVLPAVLLDNQFLRDIILREWQATPLIYSIQRGSPNEYVSVIYERVKEYLSREGYFGAV